MPGLPGVPMQPPIQALGGLVLKALLISHLLTQPRFNALKFVRPFSLNSAGLTLSMAKQP